MAPEPLYETPDRMFPGPANATYQGWKVSWSYFFEDVKPLTPQQQLPTLWKG